ncbi:MAG: hypothetical protein Q4E62_05730 [Sutterellaceae bacterium]|nr:hypothetical protein [Sutterellaceae bacterium]
MPKNKSLPASQRIDLSNPEHVYGFLFYGLENVCDTMAAGLDKVVAEVADMSESQQNVYVQKAYDKCCEKCYAYLHTLCEVFSGNAPEVAIYKDWDAAALGRTLRKEFAFQLMMLPEQEREEFDTDESIVTFALNLFMQKGQQLVLRPDNNPDEAEEQAKELHEFLIHWTELLMQKPFPEELKSRVGVAVE